MIPSIDNNIIDTLLDDLSKENKFSECVEHTQKIQQDNLQNNIFIDEFIANIKNVKFAQKQDLKKINEVLPEKNEPSKKPQEFDTNAQFFKPKPAQSEVDTTAVLSKLQKILKDLIESNVMSTQLLIL